MKARDELLKLLAVDGLVPSPVMDAVNRTVEEAKDEENLFLQNIVAIHRAVVGETPQSMVEAILGAVQQAGKKRALFDLDNLKTPISKEEWRKSINRLIKQAPPNLIPAGAETNPTSSAPYRFMDACDDIELCGMNITNHIRAVVDDVLRKKGIVA